MCGAPQEPPSPRPPPPCPKPPRIFPGPPPPRPRLREQPPLSTAKQAVAASKHTENKAVTEIALSTDIAMPLVQTPLKATSATVGMDLDFPTLQLEASQAHSRLYTGHEGVKGTEPYFVSVLPVVSSMGATSSFTFNIPSQSASPAGISFNPSKLGSFSQASASFEQQEFDVSSLIFFSIMGAVGLGVIAALLKMAFFHRVGDYTETANTDDDEEDHGQRKRHLRRISGADDDHEDGPTLAAHTIRSCRQSDHTEGTRLFCHQMDSNGLKWPKHQRENTSNTRKQMHGMNMQLPLQGVRDGMHSKRMLRRDEQDLVAMARAGQTLK